VGIAAVFIVVLAVAFFIPQGSATIELKVNYIVGEEMTYSSGFSLQYQTQPEFIFNLPINMNRTEKIKVESFDGIYYTLTHTLNYSIIGIPIVTILTEKMDKTGCSTYFLNLEGTQTQLPSNNNRASTTYLTQLLSQPQAKIGETIIIPFPAPTNSGITGNLKVTFGNPEDLTVPAGTFKVFKIDITGDSLTLAAPTSEPAVRISDLSASVHYQIYLEYGSLRQIQTFADVTVAGSQTVMGATTSPSVTISMHSTLIQDIKP
jgi:hypothetical protein